MYNNEKSISKVYVSVLIDQNKGDRKDIIGFYNDVYIKVMKDYLIQTRN